MCFDNKVFNVNGKQKDHFISTIKLVFLLLGDNTYTKAFKYVKGKGLVFYWAVPNGKDVVELMEKLDAEKTAEYIWAWLKKSKEAKEEIEFLAEKGISDDDDDDEEYNESIRWDVDCQHDGSNSIGWRVFVDSWGHIEGKWETIACVKPVFLWHGK